MSEFTIGQTVIHTKFGYRGVVIAADETFQGSDEWYETVARSRPPKNKPWYHILVHGAAHRTYVAERHLQPDETGDPINHPDVPRFFDQFREGIYTNSQALN